MRDFGTRATNPGSESTVRRPRSFAETASRYDLVLAVIPLAFAAGVLLGTTPEISDLFGVAGGGVVPLAVTAYGVVVDPLTEQRRRNQSGSVVSTAD